MNFKKSQENLGHINRYYWGCPGVHGAVTQFVNVSFLCVPVHEDTTGTIGSKFNWFLSDKEKTQAKGFVELLMFHTLLTYHYV